MEKLNKDEVLKLICKIASVLAPRYRFGYYDTEDIEQEAILIGLECLERYDSTQPLENFLWIHIKNRLKNFKRNNYIRPCPKDKNKKEWDEKYFTKKNLLEPIGLDEVNDEAESNMSVNCQSLYSMEQNEICEILDRNIPISLRNDFLKLRFGANLSRQKREKVIACIIEILEANGYEDWQTW